MEFVKWPDIMMTPLLGLWIFNWICSDPAKAERFPQTVRPHVVLPCPAVLGGVGAVFPGQPYVGGRPGLGSPPSQRTSLCSECSQRLPCVPVVTCVSPPTTRQGRVGMNSRRLFTERTMVPFKKYKTITKV